MRALVPVILARTKKENDEKSRFIEPNPVRIKVIYAAHPSWKSDGNVRSSGENAGRLSIVCGVHSVVQQHRRQVSLGDSCSILYYAQLGETYNSCYSQADPRCMSHSHLNAHERR
jgi:hypothetical protein